MYILASCQCWPATIHGVDCLLAEMYVLNMHGDMHIESLCAAGEVDGRYTGKIHRPLLWMD